MRLAFIIVLGLLCIGLNAQSKKNSDAESLEKDIKQFFKIETDRFDPEGKTWYKPKGAVPLAAESYMYCYFATIDGLPFNFRLRIETVGMDILGVQDYAFAIDGKAFKFIPDGDAERDYWNEHWHEWTDTSIGSDDLPLIEALAKAKKAEVKVNGSTYYRVKSVTEHQSILISWVLYYYKKMGGTF